MTTLKAAMSDESVSQTVASSSDGTTRINLFTHMGTEGCQLDCAEWQRWIAISTSAAGKDSFRRARYKKKNELKTGSPDTESSHMKSNTVVESNRKYRASFRFDEIAAPANSGCGTCSWLGRVLDRILLERIDLVRDAVVFEWIGHHFLLRISDPDNGRMREFQLFNRSGT